MLYDPSRHEPLQSLPWDEDRARDTIDYIVAEAERHYRPDRYWRVHPRDLEPNEDPDQVSTTLYFGAAGVIWALQHLQALGAVELSRSYVEDLDALLQKNRAWLEQLGSKDVGSYLMGDLPIAMLAYGRQPSTELSDRLAQLIENNLEHPARELMWGAPGSLLAASLLHRRSGNARWAELFRRTAAQLWAQLQWSTAFECHHWTQDLYGRQYSFLDAVHGFVGTARALLHGRHLLLATESDAWLQCIQRTIERTATREQDEVNWRDQLSVQPGRAANLLMQFCHGAPGFVISLGDFPGDALDSILLAAGEAIWSAGPLTKGSNLCHGTGGNGYAFLKLYKRTGDARWLARARAFAMHGIDQTRSAAEVHGRLRYSLWTGDLGFAIYLWDCLHEGAAFPTLDVFFAGA
jgi:hypothetical protein